MKDFRDLQVWAKAHALTLGIYRATAGFPKKELYGLTSQMRRCSASIPAISRKGVVAEGMASFTDFCRSRQVRRVNWSITFYLLVI